MKNYLQSLLTCIGKVINYCTSADHSPVVNSIPAFQADIVSLTAKQTAINNLKTQQESSITGFTETRKNLFNALVEVSYTQLRRGMAYAKKNDATLFSKLNISMSTLKRMKFSDIGTKMQGCHTALSAVGVDLLAAFGITPESLENWAASISQYTQYISTPPTKRSEHKAITQSLKEAIIDANDFLRTEVSYHADAFINVNNLFYLGFKDQLRINMGSIHHTRLVATLRDDIGNFYPNCKVTVNEFTHPETGKTYKAYADYTNINGQCTVSGFEPGIRTVTISGPAIETKTFTNINFVRAKAVEKVFACTPAFNNIPAPLSNKEKVK